METDLNRQSGYGGVGHSHGQNDRRSREPGDDIEAKCGGTRRGRGHRWLVHAIDSMVLA